MATRARAQCDVRVDREQRQIWLGHLSQDTTSSYEAAAEATDMIMNRL